MAVQSAVSFSIRLLGGLPASACCIRRSQSASSRQYNRYNFPSTAIQKCPAAGRCCGSRCQHIVHYPNRTTFGPGRNIVPDSSMQVEASLLWCQRRLSWGRPCAAQPIRAARNFKGACQPKCHAKGWIMSSPKQACPMAWHGDNRCGQGQCGAIF